MTQATLADEPVRVAAAGTPVAGGHWSARVFAGAIVIALPLLLWFGRDHWFYLDEWQILGADGESSKGYLDGHNGHWITWLRLEYLLNFELWGLRSYLPYQVPAVLGHLASAVLLRQVCRRLGARAWIATGVALAFVFFGTGRVNMTLGFQVSLTASLICAFGMFLLAEGSRAVTLRDWLALGLGLVGLMTSGVFPAVLVGFGVTTWLRRGVRVAAFYALPLGAIYLAWYVAYGRESAFPMRLTGQAASYFRRLLWSAFDGLGQVGVAAALLVVLAAVGLAAALRRAWRSRTGGRGGSARRIVHSLDRVQRSDRGDSGKPRRVRGRRAVGACQRSPRPSARRRRGRGAGPAPGGPGSGGAGAARGRAPGERRPAVGNLGVVPGEPGARPRHCPTLRSSTTSRGA